MLDKRAVLEPLPGRVVACRHLEVDVAAGLVDVQSHGERDRQPY